MTSHLTPMVQFDCKGEADILRSRWQKWKRGLNIFLKAANINDPEKQYATLLHTAGMGLQEILYNIPGATDTDNNTEIYKLAIQKLDDYFLPKNNIMHERHQFTLIYQKDGEKFDMFIRKLKEQAENCKYANTEEHIIDQIFANCNNIELKKKMLIMENEDLKLENIIKEGYALETVGRKLKKYKDTERTANIKQKRKKTEKCIRCGNLNHNMNYINCPAKYNKCMKCKFIGHYQQYCLTKKTRLTQMTNIENKFYNKSKK